MLLVPTVTMEICLMWDPLMGYEALILFLQFVCVCVRTRACVCVRVRACACVFVQELVHQSTCREASFKARSLGRETAHNNRFSVATYYCTVQPGVVRQPRPVLQPGERDSADTTSVSVCVGLNG